MFLYTKISKNSSAKYYKKYEEACEIYQDLSEEEKKKQTYDPERYKNLLEDEKQKLAAYRR